MFLHGQNFELSAARRAALGDFLMGPDELVAELRSGPNLARPELEFAMQGVMKAALIGAGMDPAAARGMAFNLVHEGLYSHQRSSEIVLKLLTE